MDLYSYLSNQPVNRTDHYGTMDDGERAAKIAAFNQWYEEQHADMSWLNNLPACPSKIAVNNGTPRYCGSSSGTWGSISSANQTYHPGAKWEMRSSNYFGAGQQCTYSSNGMLITSGLAAGTPDRQSASFLNGFYLGHYFSDVSPFDAARELDGPENLGEFTGKYLEVRPPSQGGGA